MMDGLFLRIFVVHIIDVILVENWCRDNSCLYYMTEKIEITH